LGKKSLKHSHFADDTLLIGGGSTIISCRFKKVLDDFLKASGKLTNSGKSQVYFWNVSPRKQRQIGSIMGFTPVEIGRNLNI